MTEKLTDAQAQAAARKAKVKRETKNASNSAIKLERLVVEVVPIESVQPNEYNPNRQAEHDFELLCKSMEEDGFTTPILCNKDRVIIDGEHRWRAAQVLGFTEVPVVFTDMTPEQMRISTIRHNRARGQHDIELEAEVLRDFVSLGLVKEAQDALLLDDVELKRLTQELAVETTDDDYKDAWLPDTITPEDQETIRNPIVVPTPKVVNGQVTEVSAATYEALEAVRKREQLVTGAMFQQDSQRMVQENRLYRISLIFANEEAEVVRTVMGPRAADVILRLCKQELGLE